MSDEELARLSRDGSFAAFEEIVRRFDQRIYAFVFQSCRCDADAREITQETFIRAFRALAQFDFTQSFAPWIFTIARRKCIDHFRARRTPAGSRVLEDAESDANDPASLLQSREEAQNLWSLARRVLPEIQHQALWLYYVEEMPMGEIARALGKSQTHVKVILLRARRSLAARLPSPKPQNPALAASRGSRAVMGGLL